MSYSFYAYPWTMNENNLQTRLDDAASVGVQNINFAASYHAGKFIHPQSSGERVYFPQDGTVYFRPQNEYGVLKPQVASCCDEFDCMAEVAATNTLAVNAWTVLFHNSRLGMAHPDACVQNAWGNRYPYSLCPNNPDVREYGKTLCLDMAEHYSLNSILLETPGFLTYEHGYHHEFAQMRPNPWLDAWLGLCFCEHCCDGAKQEGIDAQALRYTAREEVDAFLASDADPSESMAFARLQSDLILKPELSAFLRWRANQVTALVKDITQQCAPYCRVKVIATTQKPHATAIWEGMDLAALNAVSDGLELPLYQPTVSETLADLQYVLHTVKEQQKVSVILRPGWPDMQSAGQVLETVVCMHEYGIKDIGFYNLDMLRPVNIAWLKAVLTEQ